MDGPAGKVHLYRTGAGGAPELPAAGSTAPASPTGSGAAAGARPPTGPAPAAANGGRAAGRAGSNGSAARAGGAGGAAGGSAATAATAAAPPGGQPEPVPAGVHHPPLRPSTRRAADRAARLASRQNDAGLYDASATYRPAPEEDHQGYLRPVRPELDDDDLYRLFDPARDRTSSGGPAWSR